MQLFDATKVNRHWRNNLILFVCVLILFIIGPSVLWSNAPLITTIFFSVLILSSIFVIDYTPLVRKVLIFNGGLVIGVEWLEYFYSNQSIRLLAFTLISAFLFTITITLIVHVARSKDVNVNIIFSAINGYLLLGIIGSLALLIIDSITQSPVLSNISDGTLHEYLYFSYVTLTTLGYGDLTPIHEGARVIAMVLAISGQLYIAILIAMLVGKFLSNPKSNKS